MEPDEYDEYDVDDSQNIYLLRVFPYGTEHSETIVGYAKIAIEADQRLTELQHNAGIKTNCQGIRCENNVGDPVFQWAILKRYQCHTGGVNVEWINHLCVCVDPTLEWEEKGNIRKCSHCSIIQVYDGEKKEWVGIDDWFGIVKISILDQMTIITKETGGHDD